MEVKTNGRDLNAAIDGVSTQSTPLAQAFASVARLLDTTTDHEFILRGDVYEDGVTVSVLRGKSIEPPASEAPWNNPYLDEVDRERQAIQAQRDDAEAQRVRNLLANNPAAS